MLDALTPTRAAPLPLPDLYARVERHIPAFEWPVLADDKMIGIAFSRLGGGDNIGYIIPTEEVNLFLGDVADGEVRRVCEAILAERSKIERGA